MKNNGRILSDSEVSELNEKRGVLHLGAEGGVTIFGGPEPRQRAEFSRAQGLKASAPASGRHAPRTAFAPSSGPRDLAEAIRAEQLAGAGEDAADLAAKKYPRLAAQWLSGLMKCASSELAQ